MGLLSEYYTMSDGKTIPKLGFGTWQTPNGVAPTAVVQALGLGYTHIDTARAYENEQGVGQGIKASGVARAEIFLTTKVKAEYKTYDQAKASIETSLKELDADYIDLLLIHAPRPWPEMSSDKGERYFDANIAVWKALEEAQQRGEVRSIGVSNFQIDDLENLLAHCEIRPVANQIRFHVGYTQDALVAYCHDHDILIEAYSPIGTGRLLDHPTIAAVAARVGKSVAQVCIRYTLDKGCVSLPKSVHEEYIQQNAELDFELSADDMAELDAVQA